MTDRKERDLKLFSVFAGVFTAALVLVPSTASKFIAIGSHNVPGGTLIFPLTFIINDILTEVYGYERSRRIIWTGMACQALAALVYWIVDIWPPAPIWHEQQAYHTILASAPRITLASLSAYFCGEFTNSVIVSKMKYGQRGAHGFAQAWRFVASTIVGELVDSVIFMSVGFLGVFASIEVVKTIVMLWIAKVVYEIVALPFSIPFANWVKRVEGIDQIDDPQHTRYNPFAAFFRESTSQAPSRPQ